MFKDGLDAPKAASGRNGGLLALGDGQRRIGCRSGKRRPERLRRSRPKSTHGGPGNQSDDHDSGYSSTNIGTLHTPSPRRPILVLRFICSVTYFLGSLCQGAVQFVKQCVEIFSCEPPLERFSDSLVVPFEGE